MKWFLLTLALFTGMRLKAQTDSFRLVITVGQQLTDFAVDQLGNLYLLNEAGQLKKLTPQGDSVAVFNDVRRFGKVFSIDVSNPLKALLFYRDFGTVVVLDRLLNNRNTIDLRKANILQAKAIAQSFDNGIWVYDELDGKLKRLDDNGNVYNETVDFRVLLDAPPSPVMIADMNRLVYLYDPEKGCIVMDYFGTIRNKVDLKGWKNVQVMGQRILGTRERKLVSYTPGTMQLAEQDLPEIFWGAEKLQFAIDRLYCLKDGALQVFTLSNPKP